MKLIGIRRRVGEAVLHPLDDELLELGAVEIVDRLTAGRGPGAGEGQRLLAVQVHLALVEVDLEGAARDLVADRAVQLDVDAAERVDQVPEAREVNDRDVVDLDPEQLLDGLDHQRGAAEAVGSVDLVVAELGDRRQGVAGDRQLLERAAAGSQDHDRIGAGAGCAVQRGPASRRRLDALLGLRLAGCELGVAHVGAEDEDVLREHRHQGVRVQRVAHVDELRLLDRGRDCERDEAQQEPADDRDADPLEPPPALALGLRRTRLARLLGGALAAAPAHLFAQRIEVRRTEASPRSVDLVIRLFGPVPLVIGSHSLEILAHGRGTFSWDGRLARGDRRRPGRYEDGRRGGRRGSGGASPRRGAEPRPDRRGAAGRARIGASYGSGSAAGGPVDRAWDPLHDRPRTRRRDQRGEPPARQRAHPRPDVRATGPARPDRQRRQRRGARRAPLGRRPRRHERGAAHHRHRYRRRPDPQSRGLPGDNGRRRRAGPHRDRGRRSALSGQLPEPRLRRVGRLRHRPRPRGAGRRRGTTRTRRSGA